MLDDITDVRLPAAARGDDRRRPAAPAGPDAAHPRGHDRGIGVSLAPAVTPTLTRERLAELQGRRRPGHLAEPRRLGPPRRHDGVRGVPGTFDATMEALDWAAELGPAGAGEHPRHRRDRRRPARHVRAAHRADAAAVEPVLPDLGGPWLDADRDVAGRGRAVDALAVDRSRGGAVPGQDDRGDALPARGRHGAAPRGPDRGARSRPSDVGRGFGIRDGNGIVFIAQDGAVNPSGFLPLPVGNVRETSLVELYRDDPDAARLRDVTRFKGRCGHCEFRSGAADRGPGPTPGPGTRSSPTRCARTSRTPRARRHQMTASWSSVAGSPGRPRPGRPLRSGAAVCLVEAPATVRRQGAHRSAWTGC